MIRKYEKNRMGLLLWMDMCYYFLCGYGESLDSALYGLVGDFEGSGGRVVEDYYSLNCNKIILSLVGYLSDLKNAISTALHISPVNLFDCLTAYLSF